MWIPYDKLCRFLRMNPDGSGVHVDPKPVEAIINMAMAAEDYRINVADCRIIETA